MKYLSNLPENYLPKSILCLRAYSWRAFLSDLIAGLTVGLVALPLAMAFAIASDLPPQAGLYCAVIAGFLISALGGSRTQIGGPTGAFVVVVSGIIAEHGVDGLYMCTLMAGAMLVVMGLTGFGTAVRFIPRPVVVGFTNGIAVLIASTQIKDFFGLRFEEAPGEFIERLRVVAAHWETMDPATACLSIGALLLIIVMRLTVPRVPGTILALFGGTAIVWGFGLPMETIASRFGGIPSGLPSVVLPTFRPDLILGLLAPAMTVAMLGAIESLMSAMVADRMSRDKHNPNVELFAQGVANIFSPLAGGLPATGAIARTATNIRSGARTPVAGMVHAVTLLLILLFAAPLAKHIPLCVLAAILMMVSYNMGEWREIPDILRLSKSEIAVWLITFSLTVFADLTVAVQAGMILAALVYIRNVTVTTTVTSVTPDYIQSGMEHSMQHKEIPEGVHIFRIHGPFLFGATDKLAVIEEQIDRLPPVVIIRTRNMTAIDATGLQALEELVDRLRESGRKVLICGMLSQPKRLMLRSGFHEHIGPENFVENFDMAVKRAKDLLAGVTFVAG